MTADWPVAIDAVVETVATTRGPDGAWALAALGLHPGDPVTARTWGRTRTRRNLEREGGGYVQFVRDPVVFVDAALAALDLDEPVHPAADAWVEVTAERLAEGTEGGTAWVDWALEPVEAVVVREAVPTLERGVAAVVEATVAASRLDVPAYDADALRERLAHHRDVVARCGGPREREAMARLDDLVDG